MGFGPVRPYNGAAMEWVVTILVLIGVVVITAVLFVGWVFMIIVRVVANAMKSLFGWSSGGPRAGPRTVVCSRERCHAANPPDARFCRRCGRMLRTDPQVVSRAAVW
jgi:hypothetical protein